MVSKAVKKVVKESYGRDSYVICLDFDGTVVTHEYPEIGHDIGAVPVLKRLTDAGHRIILYTMRSHRPYGDRDLLQEAIDWFKNNGIPLYGVNSHPTQNRWTDSPKVHGDLTIDDRNMGCPCKRSYQYGRYVDWAKIEEKLEDMGILNFDESKMDDPEYLTREVAKYRKEALMKEFDRLVKQGIDPDDIRLTTGEE